MLSPGGRVVVGIRDGSVMEKVDATIFTLRSPRGDRHGPRHGGLRRRGVHSAPDGATHLISAVRA